MQTHGKYLFVGLNYLKPDAPIFHTAPTHEIEHPWRICPNSWIIKLPNSRGLVVGWWKKNPGEWNESLMEILKGREVAFTEEVRSIFTSSGEDME